MRFVLLDRFYLLYQLLDHFFLFCDYAFHPDKLCFGLFKTRLHLFEPVYDGIFLKGKWLVNVSHGLCLVFDFGREILKDGKKIFTVGSRDSLQAFCNVSIPDYGLKFLEIGFLSVQQWELIPIERRCHKLLSVTND